MAQFVLIHVTKDLILWVHLYLDAASQVGIQLSRNVLEPFVLKDQLLITAQSDVQFKVNSNANIRVKTVMNFSPKTL